MKLFVATKNPHKLAEIRAILDLPSLSLVGLESFPDLPDVDEDCETFEGNARKKAVEMAAATGLWALADDSGLEVDALHGAPGVRSARYAGEPCDYRANNAKLLRELQGVKDRRARFRCALALAHPDGTVRSLEGCCEGVIADEPRGDNGFGYDPLFIPEGYSSTFAEMSETTKNAISHRAEALRRARREWGEALSAPRRRRRVLVLINPRSGIPRSLDALQRATEKAWERHGVALYYQFSHSAEDGVAKARSAVADGFGTVLVVGGDGTISSVGRALVGTDTALGAIPTGSGNGFARHFGIPLQVERAVEALADAETVLIDAGIAGDRMFLVTCSMAWDASLVRSFEKTPIRGVLPYLFAGVHEFFQYEPQDITVEIDGAAPTSFKAPMVFTVANMTQYGGGARIAPQARPDDGYLELVVALRQDVPKLVANIGRLFDGSLNRLPEVETRHFRRMVVRRAQAAPVQMDGELVEADTDIEVAIRPQALHVLVPRNRKEGA